MVAAKDAVARAGQPLLSLTGVSCTAAAACTAGGIYDYADVDQSIFAMLLAGSTWAIEEQPNPRGENVNADNAVSCSGASACTVVGSWLTRELETRPLAEGWNGTAWVRQ